MTLPILVLAVSVLIRRNAVLPRRVRARVLITGGMYTSYTVRIGGDFMEDRFLGVVPALSLTVIALESGSVAAPGRAPAATAGHHGSVARTVPLMLAFGVSAALVAGTTVPWARSGLDGSNWDFRAVGYGGIADERGVYVEEGLSAWSLERLADLERALQDFERVDDVPTDFEVVCGGLGRDGVKFGPRTHLVDSCGLADPVLARVPYASDGFRWRVGHYEREVPEGYFIALVLGDARWIQDDLVGGVFANIHPRVRRLGG